MRQTFLTMVLVLVLSTSASSQRTESDLVAELLLRMDTNRDGRLEAGEIPRRSRPAVGRLAHEAGMDLSQPLSIDRLQEQLAKRQQQQALKRRETADPRAPEQGGSRNGAAAAGRGFGRDAESPTVAGFGAPADGGGRRPVSSESQSNQDGESASNGPSGASTTEKRIRELAAGLLKRHDANKNGVLDKEEWTRLKGNPAESDLNKDGRLTLDELTVRLTNYSRGTKRDSPSFNSVTKNNSWRRSFKTKEGSRKSYRFLTPTERLAELLPSALRDWFLRKDENGDGQIAMSEFASVWTREKAIDFGGYDQNNDGVITAQEYLRVKTGVAAKE